MDTDPAVEAKLIELLRWRDPAEKMAMIKSMWSCQIKLAKAGLGRRYPEAGPDEMAKRLCALLHGRDIALRVFGWDPEREGY